MRSAMRPSSTAMPDDLIKDGARIVHWDWRRVRKKG
jgi:hypothetical protein